MEKVGESQEKLSAEMDCVMLVLGGGAGAPKSLAGGSMPGRVQPPRARGLLLREVRPRVFSTVWDTHSVCLCGLPIRWKFVGGIACRLFPLPGSQSSTGDSKKKGGADSPG